VTGISSFVGGGTARTLCLMTRPHPRAIREIAARDQLPSTGLPAVDRITSPARSCCLARPRRASCAVGARTVVSWADAHVRRACPRNSLLRRPVVGRARCTVGDCVLETMGSGALVSRGAIW
jgi:hypothetical protein